jgi:hypothetical protein
MFRRHEMVWRLRHLPPLGLLAILIVVSLGVRSLLLDEPCRTPCRSAADHVLVFDEDYYVNAAQVIAGIHLAPNARYAEAPSGSDPNAEHPQLAKLVIAGSIELFGDGPFAWRIGSLLFGTLAMLGLYALVRACGGGPWLALGSCALMAADNLLLVHGRIGTLDIYAVAAMVWGAALYLRGHPLAAGVVIGIGACFKLVAPYVLLALALFEVMRVWAARRDGGRVATGASGRGEGRVAAIPWRSLLLCVVAAAVVFIVLLTVMDAIARPWDPVTGHYVGGGPFSHLSHMVSYAAGQSSARGPTGIASYPWQWLGDYRPIVYLNINPAEPSPGLYGIHPAAHFLGMINPAIMLLALPGLVLAAWGLWRGAGASEVPVGSSGVSDVQVGSSGVPGAAATAAGRELDILAVAWFLGTWVPFELLSLIWSRTSYLYYMVIVMPGIYIAVARLVSRARSRPRLVGVWVVLVAAGAVLMYPFTPLP